MVKERVGTLAWLRKRLEEADTDLLREMVKAVTEVFMSAEASAACGAAYGQPSTDRVNHRNGYRERRWDTRVGTIDLAVPKLRKGTYFPEWLLAPRRRAERAMVQVVTECYVRGVSTRRVDGLVQALGLEGMSKSQVSELAKELDPIVESFRNRPLDEGPYTFVWLDAMTQRCREGGRVVSVVTAMATGVNGDGHRELLGLDVFTSEDEAGWTTFLRSLVARGLSGWPEGSDCCRAFRFFLAALSNPLHEQSVEQGTQESPRVGGYAGSIDLRPADEQGGVGTARAGGSRAGTPVPPSGGDATGGC